MIANDVLTKRVITGPYCGERGGGTRHIEAIKPLRSPPHNATGHKSHRCTGLDCTHLTCIWNHVLSLSFSRPQIGAANAHEKTPPPPPPPPPPATVGAGQGINVSFFNMPCLLSRPIAYYFLPSRFILLHFLRNLSKHRLRNVWNCEKTLIYKCTRAQINCVRP